MFFHGKHDAHEATRHAQPHTVRASAAVVVSLFSLLPKHIYLRHQPPALTVGEA